jgi:hypothetical protein
MTPGDGPADSDSRLPAEPLPAAWPPLLYQAETVDPLHRSEPGFEPHTAAPAGSTATLLRPRTEPVSLAKSPQATFAGRVAALPPDPHGHLLDLAETSDPHAHLLDLGFEDGMRDALGMAQVAAAPEPAQLVLGVAAPAPVAPVVIDPDATQVLPAFGDPSGFPDLGLPTAYHPSIGARPLGTAARRARGAAATERRTTPSPAGSGADRAIPPVGHRTARGAR